jgi:hypothetical protein
MSDRLKTFALVALLGFIGGVLADVLGTYVVPALINLLPAIFSVRQILSGIAGAILTLFIVVVWAYLTEPKVPQ